MAARFNRILVPVDFSVNTEVAVAKALELIDDAAATMHLLHVRRKGFFNMLQQYLYGYTNESRKKAQNKLNELRARITTVRPNVEVSCWLGKRQPVEQAIAEKAAALGVDLVIIGKHSLRTFFSLSGNIVSAQIATATGIPVLTVKPGSLNSEVKTVVIPVGPKFPRKKLELLDTWENKREFRIRLVTCVHHQKNETCSKQSLMNTFRLLKTNWPGPVEYEVIRGRNQAKALLKYCGKVNADMLIVYPGVETKTGGLRNRHIADMIHPDSRTQVLAIQPA